MCPGYALLLFTYMYSQPFFPVFGFAPTFPFIFFYLRFPLPLYVLTSYRVGLTVPFFLMSSCGILKSPSELDHSSLYLIFSSPL